MRSHDSRTHPFRHFREYSIVHAPVLLSMNQHKKFKVPSFADPKDIGIRIFTNGSRGYEHAH